MTAPRDPDRLIHAFLNEGLDELPDPVYDAVRNRIEQTRQRAFIGPWRTSFMTKAMKYGLAAAAVVVIAIIGYQFLGNSNTGGPGPTSPSPSPSATGRPTPSPSASAPPLTQSFTSTVHGISVSYPEGWTAQAATAPWTDRTFPLSFGISQADFLYDPTLTSDLFLTTASQPIGDSTPEGWVAEQMASGEGCTATEPVAVDGATGLIGKDGCNVAVVTTAGRGYWIELYTSGDDPVAVAAYERAWFEEVLATVQLHPEDAVDSAPSSSP
jgi:hypothetical protein